MIFMTTRASTWTARRLAESMIAVICVWGVVWDLSRRGVEVEGEALVWGPRYFRFQNSSGRRP